MPLWAIIVSLILAALMPTGAVLGVGWRLSAILAKHGAGLTQVQTDLAEHTVAEEKHFDEFRAVERRVTVLETQRTGARH